MTLQTLNGWLESLPHPSNTSDPSQDTPACGDEQLYMLFEEALAWDLLRGARITRRMLGGISDDSPVALVAYEAVLTVLAAIETNKGEMFVTLFEEACERIASIDVPEVRRRIFQFALDEVRESDFADVFASAIAELRAESATHEQSNSEN